MKPTSRTLSWAFVIIMLAVGIFTALGIILMHKQPLVLQGQAEATEIFVVLSNLHRVNHADQHRKVSIFFRNNAIQIADQGGIEQRFRLLMIGKALK